MAAESERRITTSNRQNEPQERPPPARPPQAPPPKPNSSPAGPHVGAAHADARGQSPSMRSMPPNATHRPMTSSMIIAQLPNVHAAAAVSDSANTATAPNIATRATQAGSKQTAAPPNQSQQPGYMGAQGGQRTALKLSSRPPAAQAQQQQQQQWHQTSTQASAVRQQQQRRSQQPNYMPECPPLVTNTCALDGIQQQHCTSSTALECSAISGLTTSNEHADLEPNDDPSDCSCSNSLECSLDDPSRSASSHLEQPLPGAGPMAPPPLQIHQREQQQSVMVNHHRQHYLAHPHPHHAHHNHSQHQQAHPHQTSTQSHPDHHHQKIYINQHQQDFHPQQQLYHRDASYQPPVFNRQPAQHRPLLPHASMPPALSSGARAELAPSPPLVRHSTYAATSDTITDDSIAMHPHHHHYHHRHNYMHGAHPATPPSSPSALNQRPPEELIMQPGSHQYNPAGSEFNETDRLIESAGNKLVSVAPPQKQGVNFRRSLTSRQGDGESNRWRNVPRPQAHNYRDATATSNQHNTLPLERSHNSQPNCATSSNSLQRSGHQRARANNPNNKEATTSVSNGGTTQWRHNRQQPQQHNSSNFHYSDNSQQQQSSAEAPSSSLVGGRVQSSLGVLGANGQMSSGAGGGNLVSSANSGSVSLLPHIVSPFEAAATFCPPQPPALPPICPLAITSHRTNSPWMRLSSIILTPVGIVIVLFIVVSPMLHYLM